MDQNRSQEDLSACATFPPDLASTVQLDKGQPFTAARARNTGFHRLMQLAPNLPYVQFVDGDCELAAIWPDVALSFLENTPNTCVVFGRRRERLRGAVWPLIGATLVLGGSPRRDSVWRLGRSGLAPFSAPDAATLSASHKSTVP